MSGAGSARLSKNEPSCSSAALRFRSLTLMLWLCSWRARISELMFPRSFWNLPSISSIVPRMPSQLLICRRSRSPRRHQGRLQEAAPPPADQGSPGARLLVQQHQVV